ncbi:MAG: hypothetical protein EHM41_10290 [Chloroflexi bacterium]|nr:MAG: hypothetical protein EHM41_10290 [Chloroflexota bacterium]
MNTEPYKCTVLDISGLSYADRLTAGCLQGLANRQGPRLFLNYGVYDDPEARRTNEDFLPDEIWFKKFRPYLGNQDEHNLAYYRSLYDFEIEEAGDLDAAVRLFCPLLKGLVVWDLSFPDTANPALVLAGQEDLLVVTSEQAGWAQETFGLQVKHNLCGRWDDRIRLYEWAFKELFPCCKEGFIACVEPGWHRPEFTDYLVQNRIFTYSLSSVAASRTFKLGQTLLLLLVGGPFGLRNLLFNFHLDGVVKRLGLWLMGSGSPETRLATTFQRAVKSRPYPTIFGWHTRRDDELAFMLLLSANGLRLLPSHLASNFSFHSKLPPKVRFQQEHLQPDDVTLEEKVYLTFTLSDGDQLVLMDTAELGNWRREERGKIPFNWETQPLLVEIAPALLGQYYQTRTPNDYLIAGPSGAGYIIPPLNGSLQAYLEETARICKLADISLFTPYIGDPPKRIMKQYGRVPGDFLGFIGGYAHFGRTPKYLTGGKAFIAYTWPYYKNVWDESEQVLAAVQSQIEASGPLPRFVSAHLFAYKTTLKDIYEFVQGLDPGKVKVVRADEFVLAARKYLEGKGDQI